MAIIAPIGTTNYSIPVNGARGWGTDVTVLLTRLAAVANQVVTSQYVLTADYQLKDVSGTYGLKTNFIKGIGAIASSGGFIRMASPYANPGQGASFPSGTPEGKSYTYLSWRDTTNASDLHLFPNNDNATLQFAGHTLADLTSAQTISNKTLDNTNSVSGVAITAGTITNAQVSTTAAIALSKLAAVAVSRLLVSDASGVITASSVTGTEAGYLSGVTSAIQTQLNAKVVANTAITGGTATKITYDSKGLVLSGTTLAATDMPSGIDAAKIGAGNVTNTVFNYLFNVTSDIQTQLNSKQTGNTAITPGTATKITYDAKGLVTAGTSLVAADIPSGIDASKIGTGLVTQTAFNYLQNVTSDIQNQLTNKLTGNAAITGATATKITFDSKGLVTAGTSLAATDLPTGIDVAKLSSGLVGNTKFDYLANLTSDVQIQLNNKQAKTVNLTSLSAINSGTYVYWNDPVNGFFTASSAVVRNDISPLTTKGDLWVYDTTNSRLGVGANNFVLTADSTAASGMKWAAPAGGTFTASSVDTLTNKSIDGLSNTFTNVPFTALSTFTSAQIAAKVTDETGTGSMVFASSPSLTTPNLGTPSAAVLTNATGLPITSGVTGLATGAATFLTTPTSANLAALLTDETGTGAAVFANSPTLVTPALGTPSALVLTNATGLTIAGGGTGQTTANAALNALLPSQTSQATKYLQTDGTNTSWAASSGGLSPAAISTSTAAVTNTMYETDVTAGSVTITLPSGTTAAVVGALDSTGLVSSTKKIIFAPATGQSIDSYATNDTASLQYPNSQAVLYRAAGSTVWKGQYQAATLANSATSTVAGVVKDRKQYVSGTAYTNGTPAVTGTNSGSVVDRAVLIPYQTVDGAWRLTFSVVGHFTSGSTTGQTTVFSGVTFKNISNYLQAVAGYFGGVTPGNFIQAYANPNTSQVILGQTTGTATSLWGCSGDVELDSKPTWAD